MKNRLENRGSYCLGFLLPVGLSIILVRNPSKRYQSRSKETKRAEPNRRSRLWILLGLLGCLLLIFFWSGGFAGVVNSIARAALDSKQLDKADWWLSNSELITAKNAESEFLRARSARKRGDLELMGVYLKSALDKGFPSTKLEREQSLALASMGQLNEKIESDIKRWLIEPGADVSDILDAYSNGLASISRFDEANGLFDLWESKVPLDPLPNYRRARIQEHLFRFDIAEKEYRKTIEKDPNHVKGRCSLARLLLLQRQPNEALELFRSCDVGRTAYAAEIGMAQCYKAMGEVEKSQPLLRKAVEADPKEVERSYQAVDEKPERLVAASDLGCIETELGNFQEAKRLLELALDFNPLDSIARYSYAVALRGLGLQKESEENFERTRVSRKALDQVTVLKEKVLRNLKDTEARLQIGKIILEHESERTGVYWIQSVFSYDPTNSDAHAALVDYYGRKKTNRISTSS